MKNTFENISRQYSNVDTSVLMGAEWIFENRKKPVLSLNSAATFWGFSDIMNEKIDITVPTGYNPKFSKHEVSTKQRNKNKYLHEIMEFILDGITFRVYSPERTLIEIIKEKGTNLNDNDINTFSNFFKHINYDSKKMEKLSDMFNVKTNYLLIKRLINNAK